LTTYEEAIDWLFEQFPAYQKIGAVAYKPDLSNTLSLCKQLNIDFNQLQYIHVAGTNGKGSTANILASICMEKRLKTGLFTSPHIQDFRERILVNGIQISQERVVSFCQQIRHLTLEVKPSFFEITWALTLTHFIESKCEICIIETGLGGRLDSTNIISPILSVITNIGMDHVAILGDTLEKIAFEKAGIIKVNIPVVIGETLPQTVGVFQETVIKRNAKIYWAEKQTFKIPFHFPADSYQWKNERTVRTAIQALNELGFDFSETQIKLGIENTKKNTGFRGRIEIISQNPLTIVDAAHNVDGIKQLLQTLTSQVSGQLHIVYGTSSDKDLQSILSIFPKDATFYLTEFSSERSAKVHDLRTTAESLDLKASYYSKMKDAAESAQQSANKTDTILITGSFFLISDLF
jgi:dihydrofolate synthase/folylpolyglutamate synthase